MRIRVAVCNLQSGIGTTRGYWHYLTTGWKYWLPHSSQPIELAADFLRQETVDMAMLCEVEAGSRRSRMVDQLSMLAGRAGLAGHHFFPTFVLGRRVNQGNAVCARWPLGRVRNHPLPGHGEPRFLSEAELLVGGTRCSIFVTHLSLERLLRASQIRHIAEHIGHDDRPTLLAGDFNVSEEAELALLDSSVLQRVTAAPTFPAWGPKRALQHLFFSRHFELLSTYAFNQFRFSDHLPLVVDLELQAGTPDSEPAQTGNRESAT